MSILPIQTNFFGVDRPPKASFRTGRCTLLPPEREDLGVRNAPQALADNIIQIQPVIPELDDFFYVVRVTGESAGGAATIDGYIDPSNYFITNVTIELGNFQTFQLADVITGDIVATVINGGNFGGLTFTFFQYIFRPAFSNLGTIGAGSTIVDFMLNRSNGLAFANGTRIWVYVNDLDELFGLLCTLYVGAPGAANQISIEPGVLYGRVLPNDAIVLLIRFDIWNTDIMPDPLDITSCIELWS
jgi:hypothetical protein